MEDVEGYGRLIDLIMKGSLHFFKIMIVFAIIILIIAIICLIAHIFGSIGILKIAKRNNEKYSVASWIPKLNNLVISKIAFNNYYVGLAMLCCSLLQFVFYYNASSFIDIVVWMICCILFINFSNPFMILYYALNFACAFQIYKKYSTKYIALIIISLLTLNLATPFIYFAIRNKSITK